MKISAINHFNNKNSQNFKGLLVRKSESINSWDYYDRPNNESYDGHYVGRISTVYNVYYPFKNESEEKIKKALDINNTKNTEKFGGYTQVQNKVTTEGETLPITEAEWNNLSKDAQEKIKKSL